MNGDCGCSKIHCISRTHSLSSYWLDSSINIKSVRRSADGGDHFTFESAPGRLYCNTPCMVLISIFSTPSTSGSCAFNAWTSWPVGHTIKTRMPFFAADTAASRSTADLQLPGSPNLPDSQADAHTFSGIQSASNNNGADYIARIRTLKLFLGQDCRTGLYMLRALVWLAGRYRCL